MESGIIAYFTNAFCKKSVHTTKINKLNKIIYTLLLLVVTIKPIASQIIELEHFIQVDGLVFDKTGSPIPNVNIVSFNLVHGTVSESSGVYSITSTPGDTLVFSAIGFKKALMKVPTDLAIDRLTVDVMLEDDTIRIDDVVILPWKTYEEFKQAVIDYKVNSPETDNLNINIALIRRSLQNSTTTISPEAGYRYAMQQNFNTLTTKNQYPVNNLLNPFAWSKFIQGVKGGLLRNDPSKVKAKVKKQKKSGN